MKRTVKALVFDFDGLVLDTESPEYHSWRQIYTNYGYTLPFERWATGIASDAFEPYGYLEELLGRPVDRDEVRKVRRVHFGELMTKQEILPGVKDYISSARSLGLKVGIASNSTRSWLDGFMDSYGIAELFDVVSSFDDVGVAKPDPAVYTAALSRLGVNADEAIALEDSPNGVLSAKRAGIFCVAVPGPMTMTLSFDHADMRLTSLADIPLEEVIESFVNGPQSNDKSG